MYVQTHNISVMEYTTIIFCLKYVVNFGENLANTESFRKRTFDTNFLYGSQITYTQASLVTIRLSHFWNRYYRKALTFCYFSAKFTFILERNALMEETFGTVFCDKKRNRESKFFICLKKFSRLSLCVYMRKIAE